MTVTWHIDLDVILTSLLYRGYSITAEGGNTTAGAQIVVRLGDGTRLGAGDTTAEAVRRTLDAALDAAEASHAKECDS